MYHGKVDAKAVLDTPWIELSAQRRREVLDVRDFWGEHLLELAVRHEASWHALVEPASWPDADLNDLAQFSSTFVRLKGRWPTVDEQRRHAGRAPTDRLPGEVPEQGQLI